MPELPEVEIAARNLQRWAGHRRIVAAEASGGARIFRPDSPRALQALAGATVDSIRRVGKNLLITVHNGDAATGIWSHLGMTGKWLRRRAGDPAPRFARVHLQLEGDTALFYCDMRLFGRFRLVPGARFDDVPELKDLGPDPLTDGIDVTRLHAQLGRLTLPVKVAIMDQRLLPGVGNIQASEALFRARLHPKRPAKTLSRVETARLARGIADSFRFTLQQFAREGVDSDAADIRYVEEPRTPNPFRIYGRAGERCPRCRKATIQRVVQAQRSSFFCPVCQPAAPESQISPTRRNGKSIGRARR